jgi:hypothetical protein
MRKEDANFRDPSTNCTAPGYVHALAYLCFRGPILNERYIAKSLADSGYQMKSQLIGTRLAIYYREGVPPANLPYNGQVGQWTSCYKAGLTKK